MCKVTKRRAYVFDMFVHAAVYVNTIHGDNPIRSYVCARVCMSLDLIIAITIRRQLQCADLDLTFS